MRFINPKTDIAFKKIFGSEQSKDILISFLNSMLYDGQPIIEDLEILNPYLAPRIRGVKETYLDIKAKITGNKTAIVEMQVLNVEGFEKRILYNAAKSYSIQLQAGEDYKLLNPVIALTIVDFKMFADFDKVISHFVLKEKDYLVDYLSYDLELVFVELPKFTKELEQLETLTDKWLYFMKSGRNLQTVPETMSAVPEIEQAFAIASQANLSREELEELEQREMFIHDQRNAILKAVSTAVNDNKREIAKQLLNLLDEEAIAKTTGLSLEEVQKLKQQ
ncbi:Rpn family recombination-promoting nuclease/putative transposase [Laspinema olomoucense]|uniref:Rpn family recombination-promoting nuclease/putative transposase n=1 Tax=Laspinema olomoucense D3b TaxID=2953688 RepID=A0ABT2NBR4_9CYAN|nr:MULTISPECIES: Rpn family recombination-promoting nuclease/putative transposase [unclassified Laspinema]MCT7980127.1 Rpn family recombination-promoting nuclease/putative transposase [Laspinema sp. D3b]MCT7987320.1 Rpn family recombination-promoting nuclease/putative transposase [Laspinema sp. D3a]MCT7992114.1 Rpn family recombination-promoting nuclease/putative transposase [Laspinema sp. D3c]